MSVRIDLWEPPENNPGWSTKIDTVERRTVIGVPHWERPFVEGELGQIHGLFNGLAAGPIEGKIELILHENLCEATGHVVVYDSQTQQSLSAVLRMTTWTASGLAARYPKTDLRYTFTYALKWKEQDTATN